MGRIIFSSELPKFILLFTFSDNSLQHDLGLSKRILKIFFLELEVAAYLEFMYLINIIIKL